MGKKSVEIIGILDRSGSMHDLIDETISGYNAFIKEQREVGPAKVTLAIFDDRYDVLYESLDIAEVPKLTSREFNARGMTALRDAVGKTINVVKGNQKNGKKPDKTLVFIMTDGYENDSKEFTHRDIQKLIKKRTKKGWEFFFMGADIDAFAQGGIIGVANINIVNTSKTKSSVQQSFKTVSDTADLYRSGGSVNVSHTMEDMYNDAAAKPGDTSTSWSGSPATSTDDTEDDDEVSVTAE